MQSTNEIDVKIRNYEKNDEIKELEIYNSMITKNDPEAHQYTVEEMKYRYENKNFSSEQTKFLTDISGNIVGYCAVDIYPNGDAYLEYPFIKAEYRSDESMKKLFTEVLTFAKTKSATIRSEAYSLKYGFIHEFFEEFGYKSKNEFVNMILKLEDINFVVPDYISLGMSEDDVPAVIKFMKKFPNQTTTGITEENLRKRFQDNELASNKTFLIKKDGELRGAIGATKVESDETKESGSLNFFMLNLDDPDASEIRKFQILALVPFFKENKLTKYRISAYKSSAGYPIFQEIGFENDSESVQYVLT